MGDFISLYKRPFVEVSRGSALDGGVYIRIYDKPCFRLGESKRAPYRREDIDMLIKLCSASEVKRIGTHTFCVSDNTVIAKFTIVYVNSTIALKAEYLHENFKIKTSTLVLSPEEYLSLADGMILPYVVPISEPVKHCGSEEKMLYPVSNKFYVVYSNGDIEVRDRIDGEISLIPDGNVILPIPPKSIVEGSEMLEVIFSQLGELSKADPDLAHILFGLYAYFGVYYRYLPRRILYVWGPRGAGKTTILRYNLYEMVREVTKYLTSPSGAAIRDTLPHSNVIADDVNEDKTVRDEFDYNLLSVILASYDASTIGRANPENLRAVYFRLRGALLMAGSEPDILFKHRALARRLAVIGLPRAYTHFKLNIDSKLWNMALSIIAIADGINGYEHGVLPEDTSRAVEAIFARYSADGPKFIDTYVEEGILGDPIIEVLVGLRNKLIKIANGNIDRYRFVKTDKSGTFTECYIAIEAKRIPRVTYPESERVAVTVTKTVGVDKPLTVSETVHKRYFDAATVSATVKEYLKHIPDISMGYDKHGNPKVLIKYDCEKSVEEVRAHLLSVAADIEYVIRNLMRNRADFLNVVRA